MNSKQTLDKIQNQLKELEHKDYCKRSFRSGYLIGYFESKKNNQKSIPFTNQSQT